MTVELKRGSVMCVACALVVLLLATPDASAVPPSDLDGDGLIDANDVALLVAARNTPASGPGDPRDLDDDGTLTLLDARILASACSITPGLCKTDDCQDVSCGETPFGFECGVVDNLGVCAEDNPCRGVVQAGSCFHTTCEQNQCPTDLEETVENSGLCLVYRTCVSANEPADQDQCRFDVQDPCFDSQDCDIRVVDPTARPLADSRAPPSAMAWPSASGSERDRPYRRSILRRRASSRAPS